MQLSKRLKAVASMVQERRCVADIGTDHGYVPITLVEEGRIDAAIAMDIHAGPLERARLHIAEAGLLERIQTRRSDGLEKLEPGEADTLVIAGMGGMLCLQILQAHPAVVQRVKELVLSPQSDLDVLRQGVAAMGFCLDGETMLEEDGKFYTVMHWRPGSQGALSMAEWRYGPLLLAKRDPVLKQYLLREQRLRGQIRAQLAGRQTETAGARLRELEQEEEWIEQALQRYRLQDGKDEADEM